MRHSINTLHAKALMVLLPWQQKDGSGDLTGVPISRGTLKRSTPGSDFPGTNALKEPLQIPGGVFQRWGARPR